MKTLNSIAFCALLTPAIALFSNAALAQQPANTGADRQQQSTQPGRGADATRSGSQSGSATGSDRQTQGDASRSQNRGYMSSAPARGSHASNLIGADVMTTGGDKIGSINDLIIDENGQVVAILVSVGGFLGMGKKDVAIGWDDVTRTGSSDKPELRVNMTKDNLRSAPEFKARK
ncbi:MAG: PRC-barrel domain-containing protein [Alcanivoracaceae bacterium]